MRQKPVFFALSIAAIAASLSVTATTASAQITPDTSLGAESSTVTPNQEIRGISSDRIDGGAVRGSNLFHSFQEFNVAPDRGAYFSNPATISNILTRVTGGNPSNIFGRLGVLGNANLFLINPNGIIFGPNARLDMRGSFFGSTAESILFDNNFEFSARNPQTIPQLTINIPIGLRFRDNPGSIQVQGDGQGLRTTPELIDTTSGLRVEPNQTLGLVGGDILLEGATLKTASGRIELGSIAGSGQVSITPIDKGFTLDYSNVQNFGNIQLSQQTAVDASGAGGGDIQLWGRRITLTDGSRLEASTLGAGQGGTLAVNATEQVEVVGTSLDGFYSGLFAFVYSGATGVGGNIQINTGDLLLGDGGLVIASTFGNGNAGSVKINATGTIAANGDSGIFSQVAEQAEGDSGGIEIITNNLSLINGARINASTFGQGNAGSVKVNATGDIFLDNGGIFSRVEELGQGNASGIEINTNNLSLINGGVISASTFGQGNAGSVKINTNGDISASGEDSEGFNSGIFSIVDSSAVGNAGGIEINTKNLFLNNGGLIDASTFGQGDSGIVKVSATDDISAVGEDKDGSNSGIFSRVEELGQGNASGIEINTNNLSLNNGGVISASTFGQGNAGSVKINANGDISASGEDSEGFNSGIFSAVNSSAVGNAGGIEINTNNLSLNNGGLIDASTFGQGDAGIIKINATGDISAVGEGKDGDNSGIFSRVEELAQGNASGIEINTNNLSLNNGGVISASTFGQGNAGSVKINANGDISASGEDSEGFNSGIFSIVDSLAIGNAGGIEIDANNISLTNGGKIDASTFGKGDAGIIKINAIGDIFADAEDESGANSGIFTTVEENAEGNAGGIQVNTNNLFLSNGAQINGNTLGKGNAGIVKINATGTISASGEGKDGFNSGIFSNIESSEVGNAGGIEIQTNNLSLNNGGTISASTFGQGNAGIVKINATGTISASGEDKGGFNSGIFSTVQSLAVGNAGGIEISTNNLSLSNGGVISASTFGQGNAGIIKINATGTISASGEDKGGGNSQIFSTVASSGVGNAGGIEINTNNLSLTDGAQIAASTFGQGNAGIVKINATGDISADGEDKDGFNSGIFSTVESSGVGDAGGININARSLSLTNNGTLSSSNSGNGAAGDITVTTTKDIRLDNQASIRANTNGGQGNIILNSQDLILRRQSEITTDAKGTATGGNITINTGNLVGLEASKISANAQQGFGGEVTVNAQGIFFSPNSKITASSELGPQFSGTVQLNTPELDTDRGLLKLPEDVVDPTKQIAQNPCQRGIESKFIISGRGGLPSSPNEIFASDNVRVDLVAPVISNTNTTNSSVKSTPTTTTIPKIVPARGWILNDKGEVVLIASDPTATGEGQKWSTPNGCPVP